uniref:Uncharacterized protein n=1 Tax=Anopheles maculatus TaxID=74869 RepID=A0A182SET1_9DIPT
MLLNKWLNSSVCQGRQFTLYASKGTPSPAFNDRIRAREEVPTADSRGGEIRFPPAAMVEVAGAAEPNQPGNENCFAIHVCSLVRNVKSHQRMLGLAMLHSVCFHAAILFLAHGFLGTCSVMLVHNVTLPKHVTSVRSTTDR